MDVTFYGAKKKKTRLVASAFLRGTGGVMASNPARLPLAGPVVFYGVAPETVGAWNRARAESRDRYLIDNGYFRPGKNGYFRVTLGRMQHDGRGEADPARWRALGLPLMPWRRDGSHILITLQTPWFHEWFTGVPRDQWAAEIKSELAQVTDRPIRVRLKPRGHSAIAHAPTIEDDLRGAWALVTLASNTAVDAIRLGIPAFTTMECAASAMGNTKLDTIENPVLSDDRERWARVLAANQWTLDEMASGQCADALGLA